MGGTKGQCYPSSAPGVDSLCAGVIFSVMDIELLLKNWGLAVAVVLLLGVAMFVIAALVRRAPWGQLRQALVECKARRNEHKVALSAASKAEKRLAGLLPRADTVKPRRLQEAKDRLEDARALAKIADDQLMIARNHVRRVILEEYPPRKHEQLRRKYLPDDQPDGKPFSF